MRQAKALQNVNKKYYKTPELNHRVHKAIANKDKVLNSGEHVTRLLPLQAT